MAARPGRPAAVLLTAALAAGCGGPDAAFDRSEGLEGLRGLEIEDPYRPEDFTLADTGGRPYRLHERIDGTLTLVFFGYTHCPDICPVQMAILDAALEDLSYADRRRIEVVFVTTDPERDTPERLREWLDRFDPEFVGLVGELDEVNAIQATLGLPDAKRDAPGEAAGDPGSYTVGHATPVVAITPDGRVRALYPSGVRQTDWRHDLPRLLAIGS